MSWFHDRRPNPSLPPSARGNPLPADEHRIIMWDTERADLGLVKVIEPIAPEI